ncbi:hypothetical protein ACTXT7_009317 [Hymenolepis weldensis]
MYSMEFSMPKSVPERLVSQPTVPEQQSVPKFCLRDLYANQICSLEGQKEGCCILASFRTHESSTVVKSLRCLGQCNQMRAKLTLVWRPKRSAPVDDECKQSVFLPQHSLSHELVTLDKQELSASRHAT